MNISSERLQEWLRKACSITRKSSTTDAEYSELNPIIDLLTAAYRDTIATHRFSYQYLKGNVRRTILPKLAKSPKPTLDQFKKSLNRSINSLKKPTLHHFVFPVNVFPPAKHKYNFDFKYRLCGEEILWKSNHAFNNTKYYRNAKFKTDFEKYFGRTAFFHKGSFVIIKTKAGDPQFGADKAYEVLHEFLGIINLSVHFRRLVERWGDARMSSLSEITGPHCFFQFNTGVKYANVWLNADAKTTKEITLQQWQYQRFLNFYKHLSKISKKCDIYNNVHSFLYLYNQGMGTSNKHSAFLIFWGLLENLTFMENRDNYSHMIDRIRGIFQKDNTLFLDRLDFFRSKRNSIVHKIDIDIDFDDLNFVRSIIEELFYFIIGHTKQGPVKEKLKYMMDNGHKDRKRLRMERDILIYLERTSKK